MDNENVIEKTDPAEETHRNLFEVVLFSFESCDRCTSWKCWGIWSDDRESAWHLVGLP